MSHLEEEPGPQQQRDDHSHKNSCRYQKKKSFIIQLLCTTVHMTNKAHFISNADHVTLLRSFFWPLGGERSPAHPSVSSVCF